MLDKYVGFVVKALGIDSKSTEGHRIKAELSKDFLKCKYVLTAVSMGQIRGQIRSGIQHTCSGKVIIANSVNPLAF